MTAKAYSYIRISSTKQVLGRGLDRQFEDTQAYCAERGLELVGSMRDAGLSGFHGSNRKRGALGAFLDLVRRGEIEQGSILVCEHLDRLSREPLDEALGQFLDLIRAGIVVVILFDKKEHSRASIRSSSGMGDLIMSISVMYGSNQESHKKSIRGKDVWKASRHLPMSGKSNLPGWVSKIDGQLVLDPDKQKILERIATDFQDIGASKLAMILNREQVPLVSKGRSDGAKDWQYNTIMRLIRGRAIRGEQIVNGEAVQAWPAAISETLWLAANAAADRRHDGGGVRKGTTLSNLFGSLAICSVCRSQMRIARGGTGNKTVYLVCGGSFRGTCEAGKFHKLAPIESAILHNIGRQIVPAPKTAPTGLDQELQQAQAEADELEVRYGRMFERFGDTAEDSLATKNLNSLDQQHRDKLAEVAAIKTKLALVQIEKPPSDHVATVLGLVMGLDAASDEDRYDARARISTALAGILDAVVIDPVEPVSIVTKDGSRWQHNPKSIMDFLLVEKSAAMVAAEEASRQRWARVSDLKC